MTTTGNTVEEPYFAVSTTKLVLMSLCTLNLYQAYWFYKNWCVIKNYTQDDGIMPLGRAIFYPLWAYTCFREIRGAAYKIEKYKDLPVGYLVVAIFVFNVCPYLPKPYGVLLGALSFLPIIPVNNMALAVNQLHDIHYKVNDEFSTLNKITVWIGAGMWMLILLSLKLKNGTP